MNTNLTYCVYISRHPSGWFYGGKGKTDAVLAGKYKGSGVLISNIFKKHPKSEWVTEIIKTFSDEDSAYNAEALLVTEEFVAQDKCANLDTGGRHSKRHADTKVKIGLGVKAARAVEDKSKITKTYSKARNRPAEKAQRTASIKAAKSSSEHREMMSKVAKEALSKTETRVKLQNASKQMWSDPIMRDKINAARSEACGTMWRAKISKSLTGKSRRNSIAVEIDGVYFKSIRAACLATGKNKQQLRRLPSFKEVQSAAH